MKVRSLCTVPGDLRLTFILNYDNNNNNTKCSFKTTVLAILLWFFFCWEKVLIDHSYVNVGPHQLLSKLSHKLCLHSQLSVMTTFFCIVIFTPKLFTNFVSNSSFNTVAWYYCEFLSTSFGCTVACAKCKPAMSWWLLALKVPR